MVDLKKLKSQLLSKTQEPIYGITRVEAEDLLKFSGSEVMDLLALANKVRERYMGDEVSLCSIVNAKSGHCPEDCVFCAQSQHHNTNIEKYPMLTAEKILSAAQKAEKTAPGHFGIVTSGHKLSKKDFDTILNAVKLISTNTNLRICASLGILTIEQLNQLKSAGVDKYHHNLETAESYFNQICTTHSYQERVEMVKHAKAVGLEVCSGGIIGLGEQPKQRLELVRQLANLDVDSIPINILAPIPGTPLAHQPPLKPMEILRTIAIFRLILPNKIITLAGGREKNLRDLQALALMAGANGLLIGNYLTTSGQIPDRDIKMIRDLGLRPELDDIFR